MTKSVDYIEIFCNQVLKYKEQLIVAADQSIDENQRHEILSGIAKLNEYKTIICRQFQLLMDADPAINQELLQKSFDLLDAILLGFVDGFIGEVQVNKFINFRPIENYTI
jgi:hypothetical protein